MTEHAAERVHLSQGFVEVFNHFDYSIRWYGHLRFEVFHNHHELLGWTYDGATKLDSIEKAINKAEDWWAMGGGEEAQAAWRTTVLEERQ